MPGPVLCDELYLHGSEVWISHRDEPTAFEYRGDATVGVNGNETSFQQSLAQVQLEAVVLDGQLSSTEPWSTID